jgi:hypothetical protein
MSDDVVRDALVALAQAQARAEARITDAQVRAEARITDAQVRAETRITDAQVRAETRITEAQARVDERLEAVGHALTTLADSVAHMNRGVDRLAEGTASAVEAMRATQALLSADIHALIRRLDALIEGRGNGGART